MALVGQIYQKKNYDFARFLWQVPAAKPKYKNVIIIFLFQICCIAKFT